MKKFALIAVASALLLHGCAVTSEEVKARVEGAQQAYEANQERLATQRSAEPALVRVKGNFIGGAPVELGYKAKLPSAFRDVTLRYPDAVGIRQVASRITDVTRLPVDVSLDVFQQPAAPAAASGGANGAQAQSGGAPARSGPGDMLIPMDFRGNLADFLDLLCARLGLGWSYVNGTINISRYVTKSFQLAASPGSVSYGTKVSKGSSAATGASGGANASSTGSFSGTSETAVDVKPLTPSDALLASINGMLTPGVGKATINEATGTIVVTDTRMVVDQVGKLISHENNMLTRQMALQVELITLQVNDSTQLGVDANLVYKTLSGRTSSEFRSSSSLVSAEAGSYTYSVLSGRNAGASIDIRALNGIGRVVSNVSTTLVTTNRIPVPLAQFATRGYLAATTPGTGGGTVGGTGVPGLTPGSVTTGLFLSALPTIMDSTNMLMRLSIDSSNLLSIDSTGTGTGATFQQIQYPNISGYKSDHNVTMRSGDSLVLVGLNSDQTNGANRLGILSGSLANRRAQTVQVVVVTPRIQSGI